MTATAPDPFPELPPELADSEPFPEPKRGRAPKQGKSWLALGWLVAVASGGTAMGSIYCEGGDVLGLMLEDNERRLQRPSADAARRCS